MLNVYSYSILAPNAIPSGFVDGKVASEKILAALDLGDQYRIGHTKVFFKAGVLGQLEEMREEKLSKILSNFQARIRGYLMRGKYTKLQDQRYKTVYMKRNMHDSIRYDAIRLTRGLTLSGFVYGYAPNRGSSKGGQSTTPPFKILPPFLSPRVKIYLIYYD